MRVIEAGDLEGLMAEQPEAPRPLPEAQIATLREVMNAYQGAKQNGCPFKVGDIVTPRAWTPLRPSHGQPWLVVEVLDKPQEVTVEMAMNLGAASIAGLVFDARFAALDNEGHVGAWLNPSWLFEPYTGPVTIPSGKAN